MRKKILCLIALVATSAALCAGAFRFEVRTDRPAVDYKIGEPIVFNVRLLEDDQPVSGRKIAWVREGDDRRTEKGEAASDAPFDIRTAAGKPGFIRLRLQALDAEGQPLKNGERNVAYTAGAAAGTAEFETAPEPEGFDAFWKRQKERVAAVPLRELERVPVDSKTKGVSAYDIKVGSAGEKPISGFLCMPENALPKSLPAKVVFFGYGVYPISMNAGGGQNQLILSVNAHGILNGQPREYYKALSDGELKNYAFSEKENQDPETTYFNGMMLRAIRALEYVKSLPEWDGRTLVVEGHSQGGLQAVVAAGLDGDVTLCIANQPWLADVGGAALGHLRGNWHVKPSPALLLYDPVYHIRRYKGELRLMAGLGDYVCPPSGMAAIFNNAPGPRKVVYTQGAGHTANARGEKFTHEAK